jgi:hypothetical protein
MSGVDLDRVRGAALDRIERGARAYRAAFVAAAAVEAAFLVSFVALADFSNRLHVLLLLSTVAVYTLVALGLMALGAHVSWCAGRILRALDSARPGGGPPAGGAGPGP